MIDRTLGYLCLSLPLLLVLLIIGYFLLHKKTDHETRLIEFENISGLSFINIQDPVLIHGFQTGFVKSIAIRNKKSVITIQLNRPTTIYNDYIVTVGAQGIMGDRFLNIDPGNQTFPILPDDRPLQGILLPSPPEAVAEMEQLIVYVKELRSITEVLLRGDGAMPSFVASYYKILYEIDSTIGMLSNSSEIISRNAPELVDSLEFLVFEGIKLKNSLKANIPVLLRDADAIIASGTKIVGQFDTVLLNSQAIVQKYEQLDLTKLGELVRKIQDNLCSLQVTIKDVREKGLFLPVRLW